MNMSYFQRLTRILKDYRNEVDGNIIRRDAKIRKANADYKDAYQKQKIAEAESEFEKRFNESRVDALGMAADEIRSFKEAVKKKASTFNPTTINEVNALKNVRLTPAEIRMFAEKYKGDYMALRILGEIADNSGYKLNTVYADTLLSIIDQTESICVQFLDSYNGNEHLNVTIAMVCQKDSPLEAFEKAFNNDVIPSVVNKELTNEQVTAINKLIGEGSEEEIKERVNNLCTADPSMREAIEAIDKYAPYIEKEKPATILDVETIAKVKELTATDGPIRDLFSKDPTYAPYVSELG